MDSAPSSLFSIADDNTWALRALLPHADARTRSLLSTLNSRLRARANQLVWRDFTRAFVEAPYDPVVSW